MKIFRNNSIVYKFDIVNLLHILLNFTQRNIKIRYRQAFIGIGWSLFKPLLTLLIFLFVFKYVIKLNIKTGVSYELFLLSGILPWYFFQQTFSDLSVSHLDNPSFLTKIYIPKYIIPMSYLGIGALEFLVSLSIFMIISIFIFDNYNFNYFFLLLGIFWLFLLTFFLGLAFSCLMILYRDFKHIVPILLQAGMFLSPVGYGANLIPETLRRYYFLNPFAGIIEMFRAGLINQSYEANLIIYSLFSTFLLIVISILIYFKLRFKLPEIM